MSGIIAAVIGALAWAGMAQAQVARCQYDDAVITYDEVAATRPPPPGLEVLLSSPVPTSPPSAPVEAPRRPFLIVVDRTEQSAEDPTLMVGNISVNGALIGRTYENSAHKIAVGTYRGVMRYISGSNFALGPGGSLGNRGDFLLEISGADPRTDLLFHGGNQAHHSRGCILLGPVSRTPDSTPYITSDHPLRLLRLAVYGTDTPNQSPNVDITIEIKDSIAEPSDSPVTPAAPVLVGTWQAAYQGSNRAFKFHPDGSVSENWSTWAGPFNHRGRWRSTGSGSFSMRRDGANKDLAGTFTQSEMELQGHGRFIRR